MAISDKKGNNRFINAASREEKDLNIDQILLGIMKDEFPDDPIYSKNKIFLDSPAQQARESFSDDKIKLDKNKRLVAKRNDKDVLNVSTERDEFETYDIAKTFPTINEDDLDDLLDEEWEYFEDPEEDEGDIIQIVQPAVSGLFLVNSETDLRDFHDLYITNGPATLEEDSENITDQIFCVFFINNGVAYPIPTYKTLEVMLVERGLTYDAISEATAEEIKDFDLLLDGELGENVDYDSAELEDEEEDITPYEEYVKRAMPVRDSEWNYSIRLRSGYSVKAPFLRDPGDYIKPENMRAVDGRSPVDEDGNPLPPDRYVKEDPSDAYFDQVFQKQTSKEKLREKFEGKMVIADWPSPEYDSEAVKNSPDTRADDAVLNLRMMINGHWKQVTSGRVMKLYAYLNDYDISAYNPQNAGRYGPTGYIQLLIDAGGITVIQPNGGLQDVDEDDDVDVTANTTTNDVLEGDSDLANETEPLWNAFAHIVEVDRLDFREYEEYLDNYTNGGEPFLVEELIPFEPAGSIKYYNAQQYADLTEQAIEQAEVTQIKDQIFEIWPEVASGIALVKNQLDSLPPNFSDYVQSELGRKGPLYQIWLSNEGKWKYIKKKRKKRFKTKQSRKNLFKVCSKTYRIKVNLNEKEERDLVKKYKWMQTVARDKFASWMSGGAKAGLTVGPPVAVGVGLAINQSIIIAANAAAAAAAASANAAFAASILASGGTLVGGAAGVTVAASAPSFGSIVLGAATNPITLGVAGAAALFLAVDAIAGEVPADEYDLPPWRFMDDNWYLKACIYNEVDGHVAGFEEGASSADQSLQWLAPIINDLYEVSADIDSLLLSATTAEEFRAVLTYITTTRALIDNLNDEGLFTEIVSLRNEIDKYLADQLKRQYRAIQYLRRKVHRKVGRRKKFAIAWPKGPQRVLNRYVPGCVFDNHLPGGYEAKIV